jgi:hypothetical protein
VRANKDRPFFFYFATTVPHLALQVPEDSLSEYAGSFGRNRISADSICRIGLRVPLTPR